jgi:putative oxidoreductase
MNVQLDRPASAPGTALSKLTCWAAIPLRLIVGYGFMAHGFAKVVRGPEFFIGILRALGVPSPYLMAWVTILVELVGGLAVLAGAFVPIISVPMGAILAVAMATVHLPYGFSSIKLLAVTNGRAQFGQPGYEIDLLYLACLATLVSGGSGPYSVDGARGRLKRAHDIKRQLATARIVPSGDPGRS